MTAKLQSILPWETFTFLVFIENYGEEYADFQGHGEADARVRLEEWLSKNPRIKELRLVERKIRHKKREDDWHDRRSD